MAASQAYIDLITSGVLDKRKTRSDVGKRRKKYVTVGGKIKLLVTTKRTDGEELVTIPKPTPEQVQALFWAQHDRDAAAHQKLLDRSDDEIEALDAESRAETDAMSDEQKQKLLRIQRKKDNKHWDDAMRQAAKNNPEADVEDKYRVPEVEETEEEDIS